MKCRDNYRTAGVFALIIVLFMVSQTAAQDVDLEIEMPYCEFWPGATCWMDLHLTNTTGDSITMAQLFLALSVGTGTFWFYPDWVEFPGMIDWVWVDLDPYAADTYIILPEFEWPGGCGCFHGAMFMSVLVHQNTMLSNLDEYSFGWMDTMPTTTPTPVPTVTPTPTPWPDGYVYVPPGSVFVGSRGTEMCHGADEAQHQVNITRGMFVKQYEVTQSEWVSLFGEVNLQWEHPDYPMYAMTWYDACAFCNRLSIVSGLRPCYYIDPDFLVVFDGDPPITYASVYWDPDAEGYRLPTESEWEYFCRAGRETAYNDGSRSMTCYGWDSHLDPLAWYGENSQNHPHAVGRKAPNAIGLYDAHGNADEWCWDYYDSQYPEGPVDDPTGPPVGSYRVHRGGDYLSPPSHCRSAHRNYYYPDIMEAGLRCVSEGYPAPT
nr:SUMF1/EgtB/PvdO family nonheme iron enzyme [bacterium]